jgi:hypothetical protein
MPAIKIASLIFTLIIMAICTSAASARFRKMVADVNSKLPANQRFSTSWSPRANHRRLLVQYRRLYPEGRLIYELRFLNAGSLLFPVVGLIAAGYTLSGIGFFGMGDLMIWYAYRA